MLVASTVQRHHRPIERFSLPRKTLLCVVAHPDDETFGAASTLIHAVSRGVRVVTLCATRGEAGEIMERSGATPETLPSVREAEYREAGRIMGVSESLLMGFRDSGMAGTPENEDPRAFVQQPKDVVVAKIVEVMKRLKPQVVLTMESGGGYGHPDHIFASECTLAAFEQLQGEVESPEKLYYFTFRRSLMRKAWARMAEEEPDSDMAQIDVEQLGTADEEITLTVDTTEHESRIREAFAAHKSQQSPLDRLDDDFSRSFLHEACYVRVYPQPVITGDESSLFDGI